MHATDGTLQEIEPKDVLDFPIAQFATWLDTRDSGKLYVGSSHRYSLINQLQMKSILCQ